MIHRTDLRRITDRLIAELAEADRIYDSDPFNAAWGAVSAVTVFVSKLESPASRKANLPRPLLMLSLALSSLSEGIADPLLEPAGGWKKAVSHGEAFQRAEVAGAMNVLMNTGLGEREAATQVARAIHGSKIIAGKKGEPVNVVMNWRKFVVSRGERRTSHELPDDLDLGQKAAGIYNLITEAGAREQTELGHSPSTVRANILNRLRARFPPVADPQS